MAVIRELYAASEFKRVKKVSPSPRRKRYGSASNLPVVRMVAKRGVKKNPGGEMSNETVLVLPLEGWELQELVGAEDGASLTKIREVVDLMLGGASPGGEEFRGSGGGTEGLSVGKTPF